MRRTFSVFLLIILLAPLASAQNLSVKWGELTAPDFVQALEQAGGVCMLPFGVIEKHGPAGPLATDLLNVRYAYAKFPNHYGEDSVGANAARGKAYMDQRVASYAEAIQAIKADEVSARLQQEFFEQASHPVDTKQ